MPAVQAPFEFACSGALLTIDVVDGQLVIGELSDAERKVRFADGRAPLWQLTLLDREKHRVKCASGRPERVEKSTDGVRLYWTTELGLTVAVSISGTERLALEIAVDAVPEDLALMEIAFPAFDWIPDADDTCALILPEINGQRYCDPLASVPDGDIYREKKIRDRGYPHGSQNMQFLALEKRGMVCYFGAHDEKFSGKHFTFNLNRESRRIELRPRWEIVLEYGKGYHSYPWVFQIVEGDWFDAAMIHRDFVLGTSLLDMGPLEESNRVPKWLLETPFVALRLDRGPGYEIENFIAAARLLDTPMLIRCIMWMQSAFDTEYPFLFPATPSFRSDVKKCHDAGLTVIPYLNFYSADIHGRHFAEIESAAVKTTPEGDRHIAAVWSQLKPLCAMCPSEPVYRHLVKDQLLRMLELGVDGLYLDEYGMSPSQVCYAENHGHRPGDPASKHDGFASLVKEVRAEARDFAPEAIIGIECYAESYLPDADVFISSQINIEHMIPLCQAVYHDYAFGGFGRKAFPPDVNDPAFAGAFMTKQAVQFIYGCQFGVLRTPLLPVLEADPAATRLLKALCRAWRHSNKYLACGKMLRPLDLDVPELEFRWAMHWKDCTGTVVKLPQVLNSVWQVNDGSVAVVLVNVSDEIVPVHVDLPGVYMGDELPKPYGGKANCRYPVPAMTQGMLREYTDDGVTEKLARGNTRTGFPIEVPPLGCSILVVTSDKDYSVHRREYSLRRCGVLASVSDSENWKTAAKTGKQLLTT